MLFSTVWQTQFIHGIVVAKRRYLLLNRQNNLYLIYFEWETM